MDCGFYQTFMRFTLEGDHEAHKFTLGNAFKDLRYLESMADKIGLVNGVSNAVTNAYATTVAAGGADDHVPMLPSHIDRLNGKKTS
jgi:3-hydroxyisobutyrate dehydrogenase-like beta-hydroxyacid dehydrogenase